MKTTFTERFVSAFADLDTDMQVSIYNEYAYSVGEEPIEDMGMFDDILYGKSPIDIAMMVAYGDFNPSHDYFRFDGYGNLESTDTPCYDWIYEDDLAAWYEDNQDALSCVAGKIYDSIKAEERSFDDMSKEDLWALRQEVVLNSIYTADYINSFGWDAHDIQDFFDGYCEVLGEIAKEYGDEWTDHDDIETLWAYFLGFDGDLVSQE